MAYCLPSIHAIFSTDCTLPPDAFHAFSFIVYAAPRHEGLLRATARTP